MIKYCDEYSYYHYYKSDTNENLTVKKTSLINLKQSKTRNYDYNVKYEH